MSTIALRTTAFGSALVISVTAMYGLQAIEAPMARADTGDCIAAVTAFTGAAAITPFVLAVIASGGAGYVVYNACKDLLLKSNHNPCVAPSIALDGRVMVADMLC